MPSSGIDSAGAASRVRIHQAPAGRDVDGRIFLSAGEVSGDRLGAGLARALRSLAPGLALAGCAGPAMRAAGVQAFARSEDFAVQGWEAVVLRLPLLAGRVFALRRSLVAFSPDLLVLIDSPGLNRPLLSTARRLGIPVFWLAPPQLWAWKNRPAPYLRGLSVQPLFEFERESLEAVGAEVSWHGVPGLLRPWAQGAPPSGAPTIASASSSDAPSACHPCHVGHSRTSEGCRFLAPSLEGASPRERAKIEIRKSDRDAMIEVAGGSPGGSLPGDGIVAPGRRDSTGDARQSIAVLPGSRSAIRRAHLRFFLREAIEAAGTLDLDVVLVQPEGRDRRGAAPECPDIPVLAPAVAFERSVLALSVPGTGCLEAALAGVPAVVAACPGGLDRLLARRLLDPGSKALPNRLLGELVLPEVYGTQARRPGSLAAELVRLHRRRGGVVAALGGLHGRLGPRDALEKAAESCLRLLGAAESVPADVRGPGG